MCWGLLGRKGMHWFVLLSLSKTAFNPREHINTGFVNRDV